MPGEEETPDIFSCEGLWFVSAVSKKAQEKVGAAFEVVIVLTLSLVRQTLQVRTGGIGYDFEQKILSMRRNFAVEG